MVSSATIIAQIKKEEGFMPKKYKDGFINNVQQYSIGYGHQIRPNETNLLTAYLTEAQATEMLVKDLKTYEAAINKNAKIPLNQNQFDAMVSFAYNAGTGAAAKVLNTWNTSKGDIAKTISHLSQYHKWTVNGALVVNTTLVARRKREAALFQSGSGSTITGDTSVKKKV
ncbi:lysozyme [Pedobacter vanadiisoli]|uniref:Lysozyme n=1 Tax=Pedobacter vanadiisoli TaxID=1761975 RepID=A0ABW5ME96_9SPHI